MNAASYASGGRSANGLAPGSLAALFGSNLATETLIPDPILMPTQLGGTTVTVGGIAARLLSIAPGQIDFQVPASLSGPAAVIVTTRLGSSAPYTITTDGNFGVFTRGFAGCGPAAALNPPRDGVVSVNSPEASLSPGDNFAIFGTGLFPIDPAPPDGIPAPSSPLAEYKGELSGAVFDIDGPAGPIDFAGLAPGWVGLNQLNLRLPEGVRDGCAVPVLVSAGTSGTSKPVTLSIRRGGGPCADPSTESFGAIRWERVFTHGPESDSVIDRVAVSLQASPGRRRPASPRFERGARGYNQRVNLGLECAVPGYHSLDAGDITATGPGLNAARAMVNPLGPPDNGRVTGLTQHIAVLPPGTLRPDRFKIAASGGSDLRPFDAEIQIGSGIEISTPIARAAVFDRKAPITLAWTGGGADSWVTLRIISHQGTFDQFSYVQAPASDGSITMPAEGLVALPRGLIELQLELAPGHNEPFSAAGLSLGGEETWTYLHRFLGLFLQ